MIRVGAMLRGIEPGAADGLASDLDGLATSDSRRNGVGPWNPDDPTIPTTHEA